MGTSELDLQGSWAPQSCALSTTERPVRVAEFDRFFANAVRAVERSAPTRLKLDLDPSSEVAAQAAGLVRSPLDRSRRPRTRCLRLRRNIPNGPTLWTGPRRVRRDLRRRITGLRHDRRQISPRPLGLRGHRGLSRRSSRHHVLTLARESSPHVLRARRCKRSFLVLPLSRKWTVQADSRRRGWCGSGGRVRHPTRAWPAAV
jgi:hypothetical protein